MPEKLNTNHIDESKSRTDRILGISINTLRRKLESYAIE